MFYNVIEKFVSIDGEGPTAGEIAAFIRFGGCNLCCSWCDTLYSIDKNTKGELLSKEDIYKFIKDNGTINVTLTGGEPLIQEHIEELIYFLASNKKLVIHIETNGSLPFYKFTNIWKLENVSFIIDYKLPESHMESMMDPGNYELIGKKDACKFVISSEKDLKKALDIINKYELDEKTTIFFSPVANKIEPVLIVDFMKKNKLNKIKLQLQLHKLIWQPETRGV